MSNSCWFSSPAALKRENRESNHWGDKSMIPWQCSISALPNILRYTFCSGIVFPVFPVWVGTYGRMPTN